MLTTWEILQVIIHRSSDTMTTDQSVNSLSLSVHWIPESISADQDKDELMLDKKNLTSKKNFGTFFIHFNITFTYCSLSTYWFNLLFV